MVIPIIKHVATQAGITQPQAKAAVAATFGFIQDQLAAGNGITLRNIGRFYLSDIRARNGYNVFANKHSHIGASKAVRFSPAGAWRKAIVK